MIPGNDDLETIITRGAQELAINLPHGADAAFKTYYELLEQHRKKTNLTAITGEKNIAQQHFLDSLALLKTHNFKSANTIDIGSGAGFPGVPLKIAEPTIALTLLDATGKRVNFLTELNTKLSLGATCIHARAEEAAHRADMRESYDIALSRAVARLNALCELCLPFVRIGGVFIAMKSTDTETEIAEARAAIATLGAELQNCEDYTIPGTDTTHRAITILKTKKTPEKHPRRFAKIQKAPL